MNYWKKAELKSRETLLDMSIAELEELIRKDYVRVSKKLLREIEALYDKIISESDTPLASHLYSYNRYYELIASIEKELTKLGVKEDELFTDKLTELYIKNQDIIGKSIGVYSKVNKEAAEQAVKNVWVDDGLRFSDRIWKDKSMLTAKLSSCLSDALNAGQSSERLAAEIMKTFSVSYNQAKRLVRTELAHASIQSTIDKYKSAGITEYKYIAEAGCCDECSELDGQMFPIGDIEHLPPQHPNCRCSILAVLD